MFFSNRTNIPVIDVRSPKEYGHGHICGAVNLPLFDDDERAEVGTLFKQEGPDAALLKGLDIAGTKMRYFVEESKKIAPAGNIILHCWRGGKRSASMAWLFQTAGMQCAVIEGGYKACRRYMKQQINKPASLVLLGGMTGSGKTEILHHIEKMGEQVVDLEALARHKGSAFGGIGQAEQPTTEQFENNLFEKWNVLDKKRIIWIEDESKAIGQVTIPDELFLIMRQSPVLELIMDKKSRAERIARDYARLDPEELVKAVHRIEKRLGGLNVKKSIQAIYNKDFKTAIHLILPYYDKSYNAGLGYRNSNSRHKVELDKDQPPDNAKKVIKLAGELQLFSQV